MCPGVSVITNGVSLEKLAAAGTAIYYRRWKCCGTRGNVKVETTKELSNA